MFIAFPVSDTRDREGWFVIDGTDGSPINFYRNYEGDFPFEKVCEHWKDRHVEHGVPIEVSSSQFEMWLDGHLGG